MSVDEHTIELAGSPVFYRRAPASTAAAGEPLYLHGIPASADQWTPLLERTGGIAPDLPGFGRSGKAGNLDLSLEGHARFVEQLLDALDVGAVRLIVHGWGAGGGLLFAQAHARRVLRLVLCNALPLLEGFRWDRLARMLRTPLLGELTLGAISPRVLRRLLRRGGELSDAQLRTIWGHFDQGTQRAILRLHRATPEPRLAEAGAMLEALTMPALVVWGERDPWFGAELAEAYAARLGGARLERVRDAGHWPWLADGAALERIVAFVEGG